MLKKTKNKTWAGILRDQGIEPRFYPEKGKPTHILIPKEAMHPFLAPAVTRQGSFHVTETIEYRFLKAALKKPADYLDSCEWSTPGVAGSYQYGPYREPDSILYRSCYAQVRQGLCKNFDAANICPELNKKQRAYYETTLYHYRGGFPISNEDDLNNDSTGLWIKIKLLKKPVEQQTVQTALALE